MNKPNIEKVEKEEEKRYAKRNKKGQVKMKVSGGSVKNLGRIIEKSKN